VLFFCSRWGRRLPVYLPQSLSMGAEGMSTRLRDKLYRHIQYLPADWACKNTTGDIIRGAYLDVEVVRNLSRTTCGDDPHGAAGGVRVQLLFPMNPYRHGLLFVFCR
jgi:ABC-type multidrug transport system fused ATPase/permease subunit